MIAQYQGLNVKELDQLRKELRENGIIFKITKNRITKIALKDSPVKDLEKILHRPNSYSYVIRCYNNSKNFN